jgi:hypothetical protein
MENSDGGSERPNSAVVPFGRCTSVNADGTVTVECSLANPALAQIVVAYLDGGREAANEELKRAQDAGRN